MKLTESSNNGKQQASKFVGAEEAIRAFGKGEMLILVDDEERENEGDLVIAAEHATPEAINFMAKQGRGLICAAITEERARQLELPPMVKQNTALLHTAFTVSVDAKEDTTTGISAYDRAATIQALIDPATVPADLARPGHVFPLIAHSGGVLLRPGHTEAVVDLANFAGITPAGVLCEILDEDGTMARLPGLVQLAEQFNLKIARVGDLINHRYKSEKLIEKVTNVHLPNVHGDFRLHFYESCLNPAEHHIAMVKGDIEGENPLLLRIHSECLTGDTLGSLRCDCGDQLHTALETIEEAGRGVVLYMRQEGRGIGLANKIRAYKLQDEGKDTVEANEALGFKADIREYWFAAQMIRDLGIRKVRLMTNNPQKVNGLAEYGIEVVERVPIIIDANPLNKKYLHTKKEKLGHMMEQEK
jgi:3,4-dihydroxy 2-butanone 4-phosphate synthase/GTP cyclohydrolase II